MVFPPQLSGFQCSTSTIKNEDIGHDIPSPVVSSPSNSRFSFSACISISHCLLLLLSPFLLFPSIGPQEPNISKSLWLIPELAARIFFPVNQWSNQAINHTINQLSTKQFNQSITQSINRAIHQSYIVNQSVSQRINHSVNQSINLTDWLTDWLQSVNLPTNQPIN